MQREPDADPAQNLYGTIARTFPRGEVSLAYGKPALNDDENDFANTETATDDVEVKLWRSTSRGQGFRTRRQDVGYTTASDGGRIVFEGTLADLVAARSTLTRKHLAAYVGA